MKYIPFTLIYSRLAIGIAIIFLSYYQINNYPLIAIVLLVIGLLTDIFDGIIARRLNISSQRLRRMDSTVDQVFFISFGIATYLQCPAFFKMNAAKLVILISVEALTYVVCFLKFKKEIATHTIGAKIWTLLMVSVFIEVICRCQSSVLFSFFFWLGIVTRAEIIAIVLILKSWTNDVPTFYHSIKLRQGKDIKRNKLFNG